MSESELCKEVLDYISKRGLTGSDSIESLICALEEESNDELRKSLAWEKGDE